jgi:hypothetical protein
VAPKTIILKGEGIAAEEVKPGHLAAFDSNGKLIKHATAGGNAQARFVVEQEFIGDGIDEAYAAGDQVQFVVGRPGDEIYGFIAASQTIKKGDPLESNGAGLLRKHTEPAVDEDGSAEVTVYVDAIVAYAAEDITTDGDTTARIMVEVA